MLELIEKFVEKLPAMLQAAAEALSTNNLEGCRIAVHTLKGVSGNYGYPEMYKLMQKMELDVNAGNTSAANTLMENAGLVVKRIQAGLCLMRASTQKNARV